VAEPEDDVRGTAQDHGSGPFTARLKEWLQPIHVVADPDQIDGSLAWTFAEDVMPGVQIRNYDQIVAGWGDVTWRAQALWDQTDPALLWLQPTDAVLARPTAQDALALHDGQGLPAPPSADPGEPSMPSGPRNAEAAPRTQPPPREGPRIDALVVDLMRAVDLLLLEISRHRRIAATALDEIMARSGRRASEGSPAVVELLQMTRRPRLRPLRAEARGDE
jgi:hypothetical protein